MRLSDLQQQPTKLSDIGGADGQPSPPTSFAAAFWQGLMQGGRDVLIGGAQIGSRMPQPSYFDPTGTASPGSPQQVEAYRQQAASRYASNPAVAAHPVVAGAGRFAGNAAATAPLAFVPGAGDASAAGIIARGALGGAAGAATAPAEGGDYWTTKMNQVALGAGLGGVMGAAGGALAPRLPNPKFSPQLTEGVTRAFPALRTFIGGGEERTIDGFDRTIARQVLDPIGRANEIGRNLKGHALASAVEDEISRSYDAILPHVSLSRNAMIKASSEDSPLAEIVSELDPAEHTQYTKILENRLWNKFPESGMMDGPAFKKAQSDLSSRAYAFLGTQKDDLGRALLMTVDRVNRALAEENPQFAPQLSATNNAFRLWARMRQAAGGATAAGRFSPADLLRAVRSQDPTSGRHAFATGDAVLQGYAEVGDRALGSPRASIWDLRNLFTRHGLPMELLRGIAGPSGRTLQRTTPRIAPALGSQLGGSDLPRSGDTGPSGGTIESIERRRAAANP